MTSEDKLKHRVGVVEERLDASNQQDSGLKEFMGIRFEDLGKRFDGMDSQLVAMDDRFDSLDSKIENLAANHLAHMSKEVRFSRYLAMGSLRMILGCL